MKDARRSATVAAISSSLLSGCSVCSEDTAVEPPRPRFHRARGDSVARMHVAVTAVGADRPGIVAAVSRVLYDIGGNIEDSRMAILGGHFAMVLIVAIPDGADPENLQRALAEPAGALGLITTVRPVADAPPPHAGGTTYGVSVYGAD